MKAVVKLKTEGVRKARSLVSATAPDNTSTPKHLHVESHVRGNLVTFKVETPRLDTLVATIDDLLSCIQAAENSMAAIKKSMKLR